LLKYHSLFKCRTRITRITIKPKKLFILLLLFELQKMPISHKSWNVWQYLSKTNYSNKVGIIEKLIRNKLWVCNLQKFNCSENLISCLNLFFLQKGSMKIFFYVVVLYIIGFLSLFLLSIKVSDDSLKITTNLVLTIFSDKSPHRV